MLTGDDIKTARQRAGWSQAELARLVNVSMRSIGNYERGETIPRTRMPVLEEVLAPYVGGGTGPTLAGASDAQLLAEIASRFERGASGSEHGHDQAPITRAGESPAPEVKPRWSVVEAEIAMPPEHASPHPAD